MGRDDEPVRVVVMGVAGSGKTSVGERLAARLGAAFVDADEVHPPENVAKMAAGTPLTDADRWPWLERLRDVLAGHERVVVTCSALKRSYRDVLRGAARVRFIHLDVARPVLEERLADRTGHFMAAGMLDSQLATLEPPTADERDVEIVRVSSTSTSAGQVVDEAYARVTTPPTTEAEGRAGPTGWDARP